MPRTTKVRQITPISEVKFMQLSPQVIQLAHLYCAVVDQQETGDYSRGFTPVELDARRTKIHNQFIRELAACGIDVSNREATRECAAKIVRWIPED